MPIPDKHPKLMHSQRLELERVSRAAADGSAADAAASEDEVIHVVISTETPCDTYYGTEVLSHAPGAIDMSLARTGLSLYLDHGGYPFRPTPDPLMHIGIVENIKLNNSGGKRQLEGDARFSRHELAQRCKQDALDGTLPYISVRGLPIKRKVIEPADVNDGTRQVVLTRWRPEEVSFVGIPADPSAKTVRAAGAAGALEEFEVETEVESTVHHNAQQEEHAMPVEKPNTEPAPGNSAPAGASVTRSADGGGGVAVLDRDDVARVMELCTSNGLAERAPDFIRRGLTPGEVGLEILSAKAKGQPASTTRAIPSSAEDLGASKKELKRYSVARAVEMALEYRQGRRGDDDFDGIEGDIHKELVKRLPISATRHGGILTPLRLEREDVEMVAERRPIARALGSNVSGGGAELVFDRPMEMIELLTNRALVASFGAQIYTGLANTIQFPKETGDVDVYFMNENPASPAGQTNPNYGTIDMTGKTLIGNVLIPKQLLALSSIDVENRVKFRLMNKHGLKTDWAALYGTGTSSMPMGIYFTPGVQVKDFASTPPDFDGLVDMETLVADTNADVETMGYMTSVRLAGKLKKTLVKSAAGSERIWTGRLRDAEVNGYRAGATKQVSSTMTANGGAETGGTFQGLVFGDWSNLALGYWGAFEITVDNVTRADSGQVKVVTYQMFDTAVLRPEAFCVGNNATLA